MRLEVNADIPLPTITMRSKRLGIGTFHVKNSVWMNPVVEEATYSGVLFFAIDSPLHTHVVHIDIRVEIQLTLSKNH